MIRLVARYFGSAQAVLRTPLLPLTLLLRQLLPEQSVSDRGLSQDAG